MGNDQANSRMIPPREKFEQLCLIQEQKQNPLAFSSKVLCDIFEELQNKGYIITAFIGQAGLGSIFEAQKDNIFFTVKCLVTHNPEDIQREIKVIEKFNNSKYFQQFIEGFYSEKCHIYFYITERLSCDLKLVLEHYQSKNEKFCYNEILAIAIQLTKGLCILEENNIFHNELMPENIIYDNKMKAFKLGDIGISKAKKNVVIQFAQKANGIQSKYFAPEKVKQIKDFSIQGDIYSLGLVILELTQGKLLSVEESNYIRKGFVEKYLNQDEVFKDFNEVIKKMLSAESSNRISPRLLEEQLYALKRIEEISFLSFVSKKQKVSKTHQLKILYQFQKTFSEIDLDIQYKSIQLGLSLEKTYKEMLVDSPNFVKQLIYKLDINASDNQIGDEGAKNICQVLERSSNITNLTLNLQNNSLGLEGAKQIGKSLENCKNLINLNLNLNINSVKSEGTKCIFSKLESSTNMIQFNLELDQNQIGVEGAKGIASFLEKCQYLTNLNLNLYNNSIGVEGMKSISKSLEQCKRITSLGLNLNYNQIQGDGAKSLASCLDTSYSINNLILDLGDNQIGFEGAKSIGQSLERCQSIQTLNLNLMLNNIGDEGAKSMGRSLERCRNITSLNLDLSGNQIGDSGEKVISKCLQQCKQIKTLKIYI